MLFLRSLGILLIGLPFLLILCNLGEVSNNGTRVATTVLWIGACLYSSSFERKEN